jgi:hypothetical protein
MSTVRTVKVASSPARAADSPRPSARVANGSTGAGKTRTCHGLAGMLVCSVLESPWIGSPP